MKQNLQTRFEQFKHKAGLKWAELKATAADWKLAWNEFKSVEKKQQKTAAEDPELRQFLPAALEITESPAHPLGRTIIYTLVFFFLFAVTWASFGKTDIVAVARGKIIPSDRVKVIQPLETGTVFAIHVEDGQMVEAGDKLIELDITATDADKRRFASDRMAAQLEAARLSALLNNTELQRPEGIPDALFTMQQQRLLQERAEQQSELETLQSVMVQRQSELAAVKQEIEKLNETIPLVKQRFEALRELAKDGYSSKMTALSVEEQYRSQARDLEIQKNRLTEVTAALEEAEQRLANATAVRKQKVLSTLSEAELEFTRLSSELEKTEKRMALQTLNAPISGKVQQLAVHTIGGVVTPAQELLRIVPQGGALEAEVFVENKDIGFVEAGQVTALKLDAFPFTKYGLLDGTMTNVSLDAIADEQQGLVFPARVAVAQSNINVNGKLVPISPGMSVTAEVKTGERRIIEYFLSPLLRYKQEAIRER